MLQPGISRLFKVGILTIHSESLTREHLASVEADAIPHVMVGTEGEEEFSRAILGDEPELDIEKSRSELVKVAKRLIADYPEVGAIVLECTNMPPYAAAIQAEVGLPVFDIVTLVSMAYLAAARSEFPTSRN